MKIYEEIIDRTDNPEDLHIEKAYWINRLARNKQHMGLCREITDKKKRGRYYAKLSEIHDLCNDSLAIVLRRITAINFKEAA